MHIELSSELGSIRIRSAVAKEGTSDWREKGGVRGWVAE